MGLKKLEKDRKPIILHVRLSAAHVSHLRKLCIDMAYRERKTYTISQLIRETLLQAYPPPKDAQLDMFA